MLLRYNVSHMDQHFWIKQSGMKRSGSLVFLTQSFYFSAFGLSLTTFAAVPGQSAHCAFCDHLWINILQNKLQDDTCIEREIRHYSLQSDLRHKQFIYYQHSFKLHWALSRHVKYVTRKVGKRPFSQAAQADFSLKEKHRNERKGTSKLVSCHQVPVWSPFAFPQAIRQQALIKKGYVFKHSPFPRDECPSLSHCNHFLWARKL